ncbi:MAG: T9SS type A sorting domain-containing protein [Bacteroidota bacterium]
MSTLRLVVACLALATLLLTAHPLVAQDSDPRPVVLTGAEVADLLGAAVTAPICYAHGAGAWAPCPIQVDERDWLDPAVAYPATISDADELFGGAAQLHYTAPQDYPHPGFDPVVPPDSDPTLDANDEIVTMLRFFGDRVDTVTDPPPFAPFQISEVAVEGRYVYLYVPTTPQSQAAGHDLVTYQFDLLAGDFPAAYNFEGDTRLPDAWAVGDHLAANPEYSRVETAHYATSFEDRWIQRELRLATTTVEERASVAYGPDLLDRVKYGSRPHLIGENGCERSIFSASARRGTLGIQKDGPVRALRFAQGFNSGGHNYVLHELYERVVVLRMAHQMHRTPGATMFFDYAPSTVGMTYYSNLQPTGVSIDGQPDRLPGNHYANDYLTWDMLIGPEGSLIGTWKADTNIDDLYPYSYYEDNVTPEVTQCTGDGGAYASSGNVYFVGEPDDGYLPWTDPPDVRSIDTEGELRYLHQIRRFVADGVQRTKTEADAVRAMLTAPPMPTVALVDAGGSIPVELARFDSVIDGTDVVLTWVTASETNNAGFAIERATNEWLEADVPGSFEEIAFVTGAGTASVPHAYAWRDETLAPTASHATYRLRQIDFDGAFALSPEVEVTLPAPSSLHLAAPYPNPVTDAATLAYALARAGQVRIDVFDGLGRLVATLAAERREAGRHQVTWEPNEQVGGIYLVRLSTPTGTAVQRLTLLR